jgi:hypothetical protein
MKKRRKDRRGDDKREERRGGRRKAEGRSRGVERWRRCAGWQSKWPEEVRQPAKQMAGRGAPAKPLVSDG